MRPSQIQNFIQGKKNPTKPEYTQDDINQEKIVLTNLHKNLTGQVHNDQLSRDNAKNILTSQYENYMRIASEHQENLNLIASQRSITYDSLLEQYPIPVLPEKTEQSIAGDFVSYEE